MDKSIIFNDSEHERFYYEKLEQCRCQDVYHKAIMYCLGLSPDTREHVDHIYDFELDMIKTECLHEKWQTSGSVRVVRLAFNLYNGGLPSDSTENGQEDCIEESKLYSVNEIFCCDYAPYFWEAVKIRYPEYSQRKR